MKILKITEKYNNKKLNSVILKEFSNLNINILYKALRKKDIRVNDIKVSENIFVHTGDIIKIFIVDNLLLGNSATLKIIFEDSNILIVDKPANIEVTGDDNSLTSKLSSFLRI